MSLASISIRRPVLATVMSIVIILFGIIGFFYLGIREYPAVDPPIITVSTSYVGANAEVIESQITEPLEESINGIAGVKGITSVSREGSSNITVEFELEIPLEAAANDVRDRVSRARRSLPPDVDAPSVSKADANSSPIIFLNIRSDSRNTLELTEFANNVFKERLQTIPGVSEIQIWGAKRYSMRLWMDPAKLSAYQLTPGDVRVALERENVELPSGRIEGNTTELTVRTVGLLQTPEDFNNLIIVQRGNSIIRFRDVGRAELGAENERTLLRRDGVPMVGVSIIPQPGANNIAIADEFYERVEQLKVDLPKDISLGVGFDITQYIRESIDEVLQTIYIAFILVVIIIFLFLRDWRTTIIPVIAIPISLIGSFFIMYLAGFSINVLTLLGIVLAIGLVVDDAIVVLENIYTKIESGIEPFTAGLEGTKEIFFAVLSTTIALAAVFLPVIFLQGLTGRLFREFGIVIAGSVIISSFVALTLTPMLSTRLLKVKQEHSWFYHFTEPFFIKLNQGYRNTLAAFMQRRWLAWPILVVITATFVGLYYILPAELAPLEDRSRMRVVATAPEGATFEFMDQYLMGVVDWTLKEVPQAEAVISVTAPGFGGGGGVNSGFVNVILKDPSQREESQQVLADRLSGGLKTFTGARTFVTQEPTFGNRRGGLPVQFVIQAPNMEKLKEVIPKFIETATADPTFSVVDVNLKFNKPELRVEINREKARSLGISVLDIAQTLQLSYAGQRFGYFIMDGKQYQVIGQMQRQFRNEPLDLKSLYVRNNRGEIVQLDNVVTLTEQSAPPQLYRFDRYVSATISAGLAPGKTLSQGIEAMQGVADKVLDDSFRTALDGQSRDFAESSSSLLFAFVLALIIIYLILAAQFESFIDPLIILFTVPLAITGALLSLWIFGQTLNIFSQIGIIMLIGLVTKNGILIVEFANQRKEQGLSVAEAILDASAARFRPILMTGLSTILGILPIALALGAGSESRVSMGIAVVGGLIFSGLLTLYVIPAVYSYLSRER